MSLLSLAAKLILAANANKVPRVRVPCVHVVRSVCVCVCAPYVYASRIVCVPWVCIVNRVRIGRVCV